MYIYIYIVVCMYIFVDSCILCFMPQSSQGCVPPHPDVIMFVCVSSSSSSMVYILLVLTLVV